MLTFGLISSAFDLGTFAVLRLGFGADATTFRTGWFIESTATELAAMLVLRTNRAFHTSPVGPLLLASSAAVALVTVALPFSPVAARLGLERPSAGLLVTLAAITAGYVAATELGKRIQQRRQSP